jgi:hypothetical protein
VHREIPRNAIRSEAPTSQCACEAHLCTWAQREDIAEVQGTRRREGGPARRLCRPEQQSVGVTAGKRGGRDMGKRAASACRSSVHKAGE